LPAFPNADLAKTIPFPRFLTRNSDLVYGVFPNTP